MKGHGGFSCSRSCGSVQHGTPYLSGNSKSGHAEGITSLNTSLRHFHGGWSVDGVGTAKTFQVLGYQVVLAVSRVFAIADQAFRWNHLCPSFLVQGLV